MASSSDVSLILRSEVNCSSLVSTGTLPQLCACCEGVSVCCEVVSVQVCQGGALP